MLEARDIDHFSELCDLIKRVPGGAPVDHAGVADVVANCIDRNRWDSDLATTYMHDSLNNIVLASLNEAMCDADLVDALPAPERIGCVIGSSKASLRAMESFSREFESVSATSRESWWKTCFPDAPLRCVQQVLGAAGPSLCPVAACASGLISVIQGAQLIRSGSCDVCIVGSADASLRASVLASFHRLGVTAKSAEPNSACRPFDRDRDGFIIGEGGAVMILESREHAAQRGVPSYGKLASGGWLTDTTGLTQIDGSGSVVEEVLKRCTDATSPPDLVSLHGTGTTTNDLAESHGVQRTFGERRPPCFGVKGAIGHLLGAAGSVEFALMLLAMKHGVVPGTANLTNLDENCCVDVESAVRQAPIDSAIKLSLGFGGHVAACEVFRDS